MTVSSTHLYVYFVIFQEAAAKGELKNALKGSAEKLKEEAARLIREVRNLPSPLLPRCGTPAEL